MRDLSLTLRETEEFETVESDEELGAYLEVIAPYIGWIVIYFNSLEDSLAANLREVFLRDPHQDERLDVFLAEMLFSGKCRALMHAYGQMISTGGFKLTHEDVTELENLLFECAKMRNEYAHADWIGMKQGAYVRVKSQSKKLGIAHRYKRFEVSKMDLDILFIKDTRDKLESFNEKIHDQLWGRE